jgi:nicotinate phosphoribosyltransferase
LNITRVLPESHVPYTDKYFLRSNEILKKEDINPRISMKVFCRGEGPTVRGGLDQAIEILTKYSNLETQGGEIYILNKNHFSNNEPLMIIKAPAQSIIELETMYLGVLSSAISEAAGIAPPEPGLVEEKLSRLKAIFQEIEIIYFGARHFHWSLDKTIAAAALKGGAVQTSTDIGSSNIGKKGAGTMPHIYVIILASVYGIENATLKAAELFDKHIAPEVPRITLVDTFNREITDTLAVARYFGKRKNSFRIDTCGEIFGEGEDLYDGKKTCAPEFKTGKGVTIKLVTNVRNHLIKNGFGENTEIFLSSGFANEDKARAFVNAHREFQEKTGFSLFAGVGVGEIYNVRICTADVFEVNNLPLAKTGREALNIDYSIMKRVI